MTPDQDAAIRSFYEATRRLRELQIIRSDKYLGDIAEFLCCDWFDMVLDPNPRKQHIDGTIGPLKVQVKYHGGKSTTVSLGNPDKYDELIIVLGKESVLRKDEETDRYVVFRIPSTEIKKKKDSASSSLKYTKNQIPRKYRASI
jgi:hypothetical protein